MRKLVNWLSCSFSLALLLTNLILTSGFVEAGQAIRKVVQPTPLLNQTPQSQPNQNSNLDSALVDLFGNLDVQSLSTVFNRGIPVLPNALGDMNQDSIANIWDLLRIRNIHLGIGDPASSYELVEGDLDGNAVINGSDVLMFKDVLVHKIGLPHTLDSTGGIVQGGGITLTFGPGEVDSSLIMHVDSRTASEVEIFSGVDFTSLEPDSTYFMKGFMIESNSDAFVFPPQMEIKLDSMPPCSLSGSNNLMVARRGPLGNTELVYLTELEVSGDSILLVPPPEFPTILLEDLRIETNYEPFELLYIPISNFSANLVGNIAIFESESGQKTTSSPISFYPSEFDSVGQIQGIVVPVGELPPGQASVRILHSGTGRISNALNINILPLTLAPPMSDSLLATKLQLLNMYFDSLMDHSMWTGILAPLSRELNSISQIRYMYQSLSDSLIVLEDIDVSKIEAFLRNVKIDSIIQSSLNALSDLSSLGSSRQILDPRLSTASKISIGIAGLGIATSLAGALCLSTAAGNAVLGPAACVWLWAGTGSLAIHGFAFTVLTAEKKITFGEYSSLNFQRYISNDRGDPSFLPKKYPGFCINIWRHNTNVEGRVGGRPPNSAPPDEGGGNNQCPGDCCNNPPPPCGAGEKSLNSNFPSWVNLLQSPLMDAIVTPNSGGISGIVGIVDGSGAFAIPGITPGDSITFSVYEPHSGYYDPDGGYGKSPNVAEQGLWFPVFLYFDPDTSKSIYSLSIPEWRIDTVSSGSSRFEYRLSIPLSLVGDLINIGFSSDEALTFWLQDPTWQTDQFGGFRYRDSLASCENLWQFVPDTAGTWLITVTYGLTGGDGEFAVGVSNYPNPPTPYLCGTIPYDTLRAGFFPYIVAQSASVATGDSVFVQGGVEIEFEPGASITGNGTLLRSPGSVGPLTLRPHQTSKSNNAFSYSRTSGQNDLEK